MELDTPVPGIGTLSCQSRSLQLELGPELARSERDERLQGRDEYLRAGSLDDLSFGEAPRNQPSIRRGEAKREEGVAPSEASTARGLDLQCLGLRANDSADASELEVRVSGLRPLAEASNFD